MNKENSKKILSQRVILSEKGEKTSMMIKPATLSKRLWNYLSVWYNVFPFIALGICLTVFFGLIEGPDMVLSVLLISGPVALFLILVIVSYIRFGRINAKDITLLSEGPDLFLTLLNKERVFPLKLMRLEYHGEGDHYNTEIRVFLRRDGKKRLKLFRVIKLDSKIDMPLVKKFCEKTGLHIKDARDYSKKTDTPAAAYV